MSLLCGIQDIIKHSAQYMSCIQEWIFKKGEEFTVTKRIYPFFWLFLVHKEAFAMFMYHSPVWCWVELGGIPTSIQNGREFYARNLPLPLIIGE